MSVTPVMPTTGTAWTDDPAALITTGAHKGFKQDTCVWNVAWNELHAQGKGAENTPSLVAKFAAAIIKQFNEEVAKGEIHGQAIANPNDVTTGELTVMAKATDPGVSPATAGSPTPAGTTPKTTPKTTPSTAPLQPFIGPIAPGVIRPMVNGMGQIVPSFMDPFVDPLAPGLPPPVV
jgi:hypothetical protein